MCSLVLLHGLLGGENEMQVSNSQGVGTVITLFLGGTGQKTSWSVLSPTPVDAVDCFYSNLMVPHVSSHRKYIRHSLGPIK